MSDVLQRPIWSGTAIKGGDLWRLRKVKGDAEHVAVCELWSSCFGWEVRLLVNDDLQRSQVCRSAEEWLDTADQWRAGMAERGWI
jgi:hypothetical protein